MPPKRKSVAVASAEVKDEPQEPSSSLPASKKRRKTNVAYDTLEVCQELFETIRNHKTEDGRLLCEAFIKPPKKRTEPEYYNVVSQHMDLSKVQSKLKAEEYADVEQFSADIQLIIDNNKNYHNPESQEHQDACDLWDLFTDTKSVLLSEVMGDMEEEDDRAQESSMNLRERRYAYREFLPIPKVKKEEVITPKSEDEEESPMEELFTAVAVSTEAGGRCISEMFKVLPSRSKFPVYFDIIKDPMDLRTIAQKLQNNSYATLDDIVHDLNLMVANARSFNEPGSQIYKDAATLRKLIASKHHDLIEMAKAAAPTPRVRSERIRFKRTGGLHKVSAAIAALPDRDLDEMGVPHGYTPGEQEDDDESGLEGSISGDDDDPLWQLFRVVRLHKNSLGHYVCEPFLRLPNRRIYPDYYDDIRKPISLLKIQRQLKHDRYKNLEGLCEDLNLMFENAKSYNVEDSQIHKDANYLQSLMKTKLTELQQNRDNYWRSTPISSKRRNIETSSTTSEDSSRETKRAKPAKRPLTYEEQLRKRLNNIYKTVYEYTVDLRPLRDIFMNLPSKKDYPDYYKVISEPIDLTTIDYKIKNAQYQSQDALISDFELMFNNARHYNEEISQVYKDACTLERILKAKVNLLPPLDGSRRRRSSSGSAMPLSTKLTSMYNTIRDFKDAKMRVLSTPFMKLPQKTELPDYYEVIKRPIDMNRVWQKLSNKQYMSIEEIMSDFVLMFDNACRYNEPDSLIYKDALTLQRVCLEKKQELSADDDSREVPDVKSAVQELMKSLFLATFSYTDEEGRCLSDSFSELPSKIEDGANGAKMAPCFEQIKSNLDKSRYRRMDRFQEDMFKVFEFARTASSMDSQVYEDSLELQQLFMRQRDEMCKNGEILLTPALSFTDVHLQKALEEERESRASKDRELVKEEDEKKSESADKSLSEEDSNDSLEFGSETYHIGEFIYIEPREIGQEPHIVCIEYFDTTQTEPQLKGCWFLRPNETYHLATRKFLQKEVFKSDFFDMVPLSKVLAKCHVMNVKDYFKFQPQGYNDKDVFVCESRYSGRLKSFKKIKNSGHKTAGVPCSPQIELVAREVPLVPVRVASVFAADNQTSFVDDEQVQLLDKEREEVVLEVIGSDDGCTHYEQLQAPSTWIKLDDCVLIRTEQEDRPIVVKIEKIWQDACGNAYIHGPHFLHPWQTEHPPTRLFYQREVFRSCLSSTHVTSQIVRRCAVLNMKDYCTQRPTEIPENDIFVCESKYKDNDKVIMKFKDSPVKQSKQRSALSILVCDDEIYFFKKSIVPMKEPSPLLPGTEDAIPGEAEETFTNMEASHNESFQVPGEQWPATPEPVTEGKKKKAKKVKTVSGYIVYAAECRKDIQSDHMGMSFGEISRIVGSNWKSLPKEQKEVYEARAKAIMEKNNAEAAAEALREAAAAANVAAASGQSGESSSALAPVFSNDGSHPRHPMPATPMFRSTPAVHLAPNANAASQPAPAAPPPRPASPLFLSVPPQPQRVLHSEAYLRYMESLNPQEAHTVGGWERSLYASADNTTVSQTAKLPSHWLPNNDNNQEQTVNALWALRDLMMRDTLTISRTLEFSQL